MDKRINHLYLLLMAFLMAGCPSNTIQPGVPRGTPYSSVIPKAITDTTQWDTDDPAIWINHRNPRESLVLGTDKNQDGAVYAFDLKGHVVKVCRGLERPNNVDIAYGFEFNHQIIDIAVVTERLNQRIRILRLPELELIDQGDLVVFDGNRERAPMGIAMYKRPGDQAFFVIVSGKSGPEEGYLGQYRLKEGSPGHLALTFSRYFGKYSGKKEIESIAVDDEPGFVYYSDEGYGVRKYRVDPDATDSGRELAVFASEGFAGDHEGISIYKLDNQSGYILISDQQANRFRIYSREGTPQNPDEHKLLKIIGVSATQSDGSEITSQNLPGYPDGLFVAMSDDKTFHYYHWRDIAGNDLKSAHQK